MRLALLLLAASAAALVVQMVAAAKGVSFRHGGLAVGVPFALGLAALVHAARVGWKRRG